nr:DUF2231 domain-containing protein [Paracoccus saliphilus]
MAAIHSSYGARFADNPIPGTTTLTHFAAGFLTLTLVTDFAYTQTLVLMWQDFSSWLLFFGLIAGGLAAVLWVISFATDRIRPVWGAVLLKALVLVAAFFNSLIHAGDGWTGVVPWGIGISVVTCLLMLGAALLNRRATDDRLLLRA